MEADSSNEYTLAEVRRLILQKKVDEAFNKASLQTHKSVLGNTEEQLQLARKERLQPKDFPDDTILDFGPPKELGGHVFTDNPHEYPMLMQMAVQKLIDSGNYPSFLAEEVKQSGREVVEHELKHSVRGLALEGLRIRYGLRFYKDKEGGNVGITPLIQKTGTVTLRASKDIISGTSNFSASGREQLGLKITKTKKG